MTTGAYSPYWHIWITAAAEREEAADAVEHHSNLFPEINSLKNVRFWAHCAGNGLTNF